MTIATAATPARLAPAWTRRRILLSTIIVATVAGAVWGLWRVDMSITALIDGWPETRNLIERMLSPKIAAADRGTLIRSVVDTFFMAVLGTFIAVVLSLPLGFLAASNVMPNRFVRGVARAIITFTRAVPELILALIFVRVFSIGVLPGVLALGLHSIGFCAKLFADAAENVDVGQREGVVATGASRLQELVSGVWSQMVPSVIATSLYRLEINFRAATLLGLVGAGGIGLQIRAYQGTLRYQELLGVTLIIVVAVIAIEMFSAAARRTILGASDPFAKGGDAGFRLRRIKRYVWSPAPNVTSRSLTQPWTASRVKMHLFAWATAVLVVLGFIIPDLSVTRFFTSLSDIPATMSRMVPGDFSWWTPRVRGDLIETIAIGLAATGIAMVVAVPVAFLAAANVSPNRWVYRITRLVMIIGRATPELIVAVIFVAALGLGPRTGTLALAVGVFGLATRLFADAIEEAKPGPREGVVSTGAGRLQETISSVVPQVLPTLIGQGLYVFDVSLRSSTVLGIVGGGGIGFLISNGMRTMNFEFVGGLIVCIFVIVYAIELLANWVRKQVL